MSLVKTEKASTRKDEKGWVYKKSPRLDHADFLIDDIEIRPIEGREEVGSQNATFLKILC